MPWDSEDATRHTKSARSGKDKRQWSHVANAALARGASDRSAIRQANAVVGRAARRKGRRSARS